MLRIAHVGDLAALRPTRANLNDVVYETIKQRLVRRELGPGEKVSLHELATALGVSRSPVHHALTRLVAEGLLTVKSRRGYYVTAADRGGDRGGIRGPAGARAAGGGGGRRPGRPRRPAPLPRAARDHHRGRLARGLGHRKRRVPRVPGRPRREHAALALLPRALRQPDDAGDPRRQARGRLVPADRARGDRRRLRGRRPRGGARGDPRRTSRPAGGSRWRRSRAREACSSAVASRP